MQKLVVGKCFVEYSGLSLFAVRTAVLQVIEMAVPACKSHELVTKYRRLQKVKIGFEKLAVSGSQQSYGVTQMDHKYR